MSDARVEHEKMIRRAVGELALLGLLGTVTMTGCQALKAEAERVLFSDPPSKEKTQLCELLDMTQAALDADIQAALQAVGYKQQTNFYH